MQLSSSHEDYLATLWKLKEWNDAPVTTGQLTKTLGVSASTVSEGVSKLAKMGFVYHEPYGAVSFTDKGRMVAARIVRIHRVIETALVRFLNYSWDEVHEEAGSIEHAVSEKFITRLDAALGHPERDPHGDIIPRGDDATPRSTAPGIHLASAPDNVKMRIERVSDQLPDLLSYLASEGMIPGTIITANTHSGPGLIEISSETNKAAISLTMAESILVSIVDN
ncbi:metal-dependent transcriptional regulator [Actinotignum urinale]|uniref:Manganese transport regulator n=1 Tax=Actinotignum urinale TaxID=190146 RepID=A0AAW9HV16_9ACTO|nr:metal-dependent transcriptional regulator [Actinotignum urinale]MDY5154694.1 metal-dependent transcriptional regulator [Actinotignum urinale]